MTRSNLGRSGQPSPSPFLHSCARALRRVYRARIPSRSASPSFVEEPTGNRTGPCGVPQGMTRHAMIALIVALSVLALLALAGCGGGHY